MLKLVSCLHYYLLVLFELFRISADQLATNKPSFSRWLDPANWRHDKTAELQSMRAVAEHFAVLLAAAGYEGVKLQSEWERLKVSKNPSMKVLMGMTFGRLFCSTEGRDIEMCVCW